MSVRVQVQAANDEHDSPRCRVCETAFTPHRKVKHRQKVCEKLACQIQWRKQQQAQWRKDNPTYFHGRYDDLKRWRQRHPDYQRQWRAQRRTQHAERLAVSVVREIQSQLNREKTGTPWEQARGLCEIQFELTTRLHNVLTQLRAAAEVRYNRS